MKLSEQTVDYNFCAGHNFYGHTACPGCGEKVLLRHVLDVLGPETIMVVPAGCAAVTDGIFPHSLAPVPLLHVPFGATSSTAAGVRAALDMSGRSNVTVLAWAGDGATFDIGMGALSAIAERNENILYVCYDNEAYMNTGIQRSSATPIGTWTTTTPRSHLKTEPKKDIDRIMAAHRVPYVATGSPAFLDDLQAKVARAKGMRGLRFLHLFSACPPGWKSDPAESITISRLAVECNLFPLYEIINGTDYHLTYESKGQPVTDYLKLQGRFRHMDKDKVAALSIEADQFYQFLKSEEARDNNFAAGEEE